MLDKTRKALIHIALMKKDKPYTSLNKSDLFEALKYARHIATAALDAEAHANQRKDQ